MRKVHKQNLILAAICILLIAGASLWSIHHRKQCWEIKGTAPGALTFEGVRVYLENEHLGSIDSAIIRDSKFRFSGKYSPQYECEPLRIVVRAPHAHYVSLVILEPNTKLTVDLKDFSAKGTLLNEDLGQYLYDCDSIEGYYYSELRKLSLEALESPVSLSELDSLYFCMQKAIVKRSEKTLQVHPNDLVGVEALAAILVRSNSIPTLNINEVMKDLGPKITQNRHIIELRKAAIREMLTREGSLFTDVELVDSHGHPVKLSKYAGKGKYTILDFWASWCKPCITQMALLNRLAGKYSTEDLDIIGIHIGGSLEELRIMRQKLVLNWPQLLDEERKAAQQYNVMFIPEAILLDPNGCIIARNLGGKQLIDTLAHYLDDPELQ